MSGEPFRVLLIEDNPIVIKMTTRLGEEQGCKVDCVTTGEEAIAFVTEKNYDLVLVDIGLPNLSGFEATQIIRQLKKDNNLPIIAMTAYKLNPEILKEAQDSGMNGYVIKPMISKIFTLILKNFVKEKKLMDGQLHWITEDEEIISFSSPERK